MCGMHCLRSMYTLGIAVFLAVGIAPETRGQAAASPYQTFRKVLVEYFRPQLLIPVMTPRGEQVGHVYDSSDLRLLADASNCFPTLKPRPPEKTTFPVALITADANLALALGVPSIGSANAAFNTVRTVQIGFEDVRVSLATVATLRQSFLKKTACPDLTPIIEGKYVKTPAASPPLVVAEVYTGKRRVTFTTAPSGSASLNVADLKSLISKIGLKISVEATAKAAGSQQFTLISDEALPIAIRPAFIARQFVGTSMSGENEKLRMEGVTWEALEAEPSEAQLEAFGKLLDTQYCPTEACLKTAPAK
jgi:hypothetical protein